MNYLSILRCDTANSDRGFTVTLFVAGCARRCRGCFNPESWDCSAGRPFGEKEKEVIFNELAHPWCRGLSILGGEPMSVLSDNRKAVIALLSEVRSRFPDKFVYMWSGYTREELEADPETRPALGLVDRLIDGPFMLDRKRAGLLLRGSDNQRVIDIPRPPDGSGDEA